MKSVTRLVAVALIAALALSLVGCSNKGVAAKVNGTKIMTSEIDTQVAAIKKQMPQLFTGPQAKTSELELRKQILNNLIEGILVVKAADKEGIKVTDADVTKQFDTLKKSLGTEAAFQAALKKAGTNETELRASVRKQLLSRDLTAKLVKDVTVSEADIQKYYKDNPKQFEVAAGKHVAHILYGPKDEAKAKATLVKLQAGADFAAIAKTDSIDGSASNGGDVGWSSTPTAWVVPFAAAVDKLETIGELSPVTKSEFGFHIIKLLETRKVGRQTLAEAKEQIKALVQKQRETELYTDYIAEFKKTAKIEILDKTLQAATPTTPQAPTTPGTAPKK